MTHLAQQPRQEEEEEEGGEGGGGLGNSPASSIFSPSFHSFFLFQGK